MNDDRKKDKNVTKRVVTVQSNGDRERKKKVPGRGGSVTKGLDKVEIERREIESEARLVVVYDRVVDVG